MWEGVRWAVLVAVWEGARWAVDECFGSTLLFLFFFQGWIEVVWESVRWAVLVVVCLVRGVRWAVLVAVCLVRGG